MTADRNDLPFPYEIDVDAQIVYAAVGPWNADAVRSWVEALLNDPKYLPGMRALINLRFAAGPIPGLKTMRAIAEVLQPLTSIPARTRWAFLVEPGDMFDRMRLLETLTSAGYIRIRAFDDHMQAITWLGLESPSAPWRR